MSIFRKSTKSLLIILRNNLDVYNHAGLCHLVIALKKDGKINRFQRDRLMKFIINNRPKEQSKHFNLNMCRSPYYWPVYDQISRGLWLDDMIKSL